MPYIILRDPLRHNAKFIPKELIPKIQTNKFWLVGYQFIPQQNYKKEKKTKENHFSKKLQVRNS